MNPDLPALAGILADWLEPARNIPAVYLFGSRVRGDHRPNSDVDLRLFIDEWRNLERADMDWWAKENETDFALLKSRLPGPLAIHREQSDDADRAIGTRVGPGRMRVDATEKKAGARPVPRPSAGASWHSRC
ncbi:nucleotidyltransferase domain-containing protein [Bradyrhizobium sp. CCBAU 53421]|uniref:nucleotidyltransferase domain-containing protein n=1 Tax=Bradyrhizobium sp. CCBAU 53421 TaxID=1325120 RepID=UPI00188D38DB|nr:nucleotidyltransferase domain-containing protein [Bradyrhizobium sp. CCBAU 53421]QOZ34438.1 hypothetical protein XH92_24540 [Bradyrhizobium sp. CCBAU 53421]